MAAPALIEATQETKEIISPVLGHYTDQYTYIIDQQTLVPIEVRKVTVPPAVFPTDRP